LLKRKHKEATQINPTAFPFRPYLQNSKANTKGEGLVSLWLKLLYIIQAESITQYVKFLNLPLK
jgi:hypothetical protein